MQRENVCHFPAQDLFDGRDVFGAFGQNQNLAATGKRIYHFAPDRRCTGLIGGNVPEDILNTCFGGQFIFMGRMRGMTSRSCGAVAGREAT